MDAGEQLIAHVYAGRTAVVGELLSQGVAVDGKQAGTSWSPLLLACAEGHADIVELLLRRNSDVDQSLDDGSTPLMLAATMGHLDVVRLLLRESAHVEARRVDGTSALMVACGNGHDDVAAILITLGGADLEAQNTRGETALALAACYRHRDVVAMLLQHGALLEAGNDYAGMRWGNINEGVIQEVK